MCAAIDIDRELEPDMAFAVAPVNDLSGDQLFVRDQAIHPASVSRRV
jgi:hypothetical protein